MRLKKPVLTLKAEYENEKRKLASSGSETKRSRLLFSEALETGITGSIYHPKFMDFDLTVEFAPKQHKEKYDSSVTSDNKWRESYLSRYNFIATFLRDKPYNFMLFGDKGHDVQNHDFFERQTIDMTSYGARINSIRGFLPLRSSYEHSEKEIDRSFRATQRFEDDKIYFQVTPTIKIVGKVRMEYTRHKFLREQEGIPDYEGTSDRVSLSNIRHFGADENMRLNTYLRFYDLRGTRESRDISWNETFNIEHTESLESWYTYDFSDWTAESVNRTQHVANIGLRHELYESLASSLVLRGEDIKSTSFDEREVGFSIDESYRKKIGPAMLRLGANFAYYRHKRDSSGSVLNIIDERHTLLDGTPTYLSETSGIDTSTITVTDTTGTIPYTSGVDYQIIEDPSGRVEIRRVGGGGINNGDSILVDYVVTRNPSFRYDRLLNRLRAEVGFYDDAFRVYFRRYQQHYRDGDDESDIIFDNVVDEIYGCELRRNWMSFRAEYQDHDSDLTPWRGLRLGGDIRWRISPRTYVTLHSSQNYVKLADGPRKYFDVRGSYSFRLSPSSVFRVEAGHRWQKGHGIDLKNFSAGAHYRTWIGKLFFEIGYEYETEDSFADEEVNHFGYGKIQRVF